MMSKMLWLTLLASAGCAPLPTATGELAEAQLNDDPGKKNQGESLRGTQLASNYAGFGFFAAQGTATAITVAVHIEHGALVGRRVVFLNKVNDIVQPPPILEG